MGSRGNDQTTEGLPGYCRLGRTWSPVRRIPNRFLDAIKENLVDRQVVDRALVRLFKELFALGLFENPYVDEEAADSLVNTPKSRKQAYKAHLESVVALKNHGGLLPLTEEKTRGKKIYVELFCKDDYTEKELETMALSGSRVDPAKTISDFAAFVREDHPEWEFVDDYREADVAVLMLNPTSGSYFEATPSYLELNILEETGFIWSGSGRFGRLCPRW